ncbi:hypothetical protein Bealeia1_01863 [Candidatus Bealeia paramacronuclearis]|uniref:Uncharacterized protein n=1 Tax=Candidatus Bealeia paramacronuclearis TaxID=1921001 RepID=A0ABZ2C880_9PROT
MMTPPPLWQVRFYCPASFSETFAEAFEDEAAATSWIGEDEDSEWLVELILKRNPPQNSSKKKSPILKINGIQKSLNFL